MNSDYYPSDNSDTNSDYSVTNSDYIVPDSEYVDATNSDYDVTNTNYDVTNNQYDVTNSDYDVTGSDYDVSGDVESLCHVFSGESNIVLDIVESLGNDYSQPTSPKALPIHGKFFINVIFKRSKTYYSILSQ